MKPMTVRTAVVFAVLAVFVVAMVVAGCASTTPTTTTTTTQPSATTGTPEETTSPEAGSSQTTAEEQTPNETSTATVLSGAALGSKIWNTGDDNNGPVTWTQGVPNKMKGGACKQCHGPLGKGGPNGAPNITYPKIKGAFKTEALFARAVSKGLDEAGKALDKKMPRYGALAPDDLTGLWDFVKTLK